MGRAGKSFHIQASFAEGSSESLMIADLPWVAEM
jgi:hypothetical protein